MNRNWQVYLVVVALGCASGTAAGQPGPTAVAQKSHGPKLSDLLARTRKPAGPEADVPLARVSPRLEESVRMLAMDNFTSATAALEPLLSNSTGKDEKVEVAAWLGIAYGLQAITYPNQGRQPATSATKYLEEAISLNPDVIEAPDVARIMAEMVGHGWAANDPEKALDEAEQKAEQSRRAVDFYYAGVISRRLAARAWAYGDTTEQDKRTLSLFAKAVARDPSRYESWSAYLPALLPNGMHDLATLESAAMYEHFQNLRTPLLYDQGPAVVRMSNSSFRTVQQDEELLSSVAAKWPDAPMPPFEMAMRAIETSPTLALEMFPKLIANFENGKLKPLPREAGYYPSALYKYGFLLQSAGRLDESLQAYEKVRQLSPAYAEVNLNIAIVKALQAEETPAGKQKVALLQEALESAKKQEELDYRGKTADRAQEIRRKLQVELLKAKRAEGAAAPNVTGAGD